MSTTDLNLGTVPNVAGSSLHVNHIILALKKDMQLYTLTPHSQWAWLISNATIIMLTYNAMPLSLVCRP